MNTVVRYYAMLVMLYSMVEESQSCLMQHSTLNKTLKSHTATQTQTQTYLEQW